MPDGAIRVKENYTPEGNLAASTIMYKKSGYNPQHNDWFWVKSLADGTVEKEGMGRGLPELPRRRQGKRTTSGPDHYSSLDSRNVSAHPISRSRRERSSASSVAASTPRSVLRVAPSASSTPTAPTLAPRR